jgi:hypothetical protein
VERVAGSGMQVGTPPFMGEPPLVVRLTEEIVKAIEYLNAKKRRKRFVLLKGGLHEDAG